MADIHKIEVAGDEITVSLKVSKEEYDNLRQKTSELVLVPTMPEDMNHVLTTGTLGNSNRIMLPKRVMERESIASLDKKVPARVLRSNGDVFLLIRLKESAVGIPSFGE
jgi:hypothetical protein